MAQAFNLTLTIPLLSLTKLVSEVIITVTNFFLSEFNTFHFAQISEGLLSSMENLWILWHTMDAGIWAGLIWLGPPQHSYRTHCKFQQSELKLTCQTGSKKKKKWGSNSAHVGHVLKVMFWYMHCIFSTLYLAWVPCLHSQTRELELLGSFLKEVAKTELYWVDLYIMFP